ncbi:uncharacterized protein TRUGW13939_08568 [Talaromyces rugulosus]|uniref:HAT C-terminal dimerisation domain-containing protein n=1 Tax=Talaromyces rugulosus TaxID=121627 RepID=A0A7H8R4Z0_TALRU|nr:uncharacterized protein TRUGW13939_08568 [Talaromyces rugulosus]QKX61420.1 hypothetical protein TRUGW13939_08568 [Talaromyces rugulosus]
MSQSQLSDFTSSLYSGDIDDLPSLSTQQITPSASHHTIDSGFHRPDDLLVPPSLIRVGPDRRNRFVLYDKMSHNEFIDWWLQTDYGRKRKINWDSHRHTVIWNSYNQVAEGVDGTPKVMCKRCGKILEHPYSLSLNSSGKAQYHGTSTIQKHLKTAGCLRSEKGKKAEITKFLQKEGEISADIPFLQEDWEDDILQFLTLNRLPFHLIEHPSFKRIIYKARSALVAPVIPSADTIRRRLGSLVKDRQQRVLRTLPAGSKISIALDCWTSPFSQAFMAITGYFIDSDWVYREVLLGFKPLHGTHTGSYLSGVLMETLVENNIEDRVFGLTTDNASNNKALAASLQQALSDGVIITRIPCLAHVIQLSLNQLLVRIKAVPSNESAETKWTESQSRLVQENAKQCQISSTLNKVRYLAIYINASPQRRETFYNLQTTNVKIVPIQDVKTRWNSTFLMLRRAKRLRAIFSLFCAEYDCEEMLLSEHEWRQIDYLLCITEPFFDYTTQLSKTRDVTAHYVFKIYNRLFDHLERSQTQLQRKRVPWKKQMLDALDAGRTKLDEYYAQTDTIRGHIYAVSTMLAPVNKFRFFLSSDWDQKWRDIYRNAFQQALIPYQAQVKSQSQDAYSSHTAAQPSSRLEEMLDGKDIQPRAMTDEISQYLDSDTVSVGPLIFWKEHQYRFLAIAALARDALSFPATGAGVERLFNTARDVCHYRRGRMKTETIEELMMFLCTSKFDIEAQEAKLLEKFFSQDELEAAKEEREEKLNKDEINPISDTEEQEDELENGPENEMEDIGLDTTSLSAAEPDSPGSPSLPPTCTQTRVSGRKRKSREDDIFEYH